MQSQDVCAALAAQTSGVKNPQSLEKFPVFRSDRTALHDQILKTDLTGAGAFGPGIDEIEQKLRRLFPTLSEKEVSGRQRGNRYGIDPVVADTDDTHVFRNISSGFAKDENSLLHTNAGSSASGV